MTWHEQFLSTNQKKKSISTQTDLFALFEEVWKKQESNLTKKQRSMLSDDFYKNSLFEIFSGIDYSNLIRKPLTESKDYKTLLKEQEEEPSVEEIKLGLPKLRISEDWGKPDSADRQIIQRFTASVAGETLEEKLLNINNIATGEVQLASIGQILGTMVVIEVLSAILSQFTEAAGGFIFEGFLAGLFGQDSVQITDVADDDGATGKPITDVELGGKEYSLKLLNPTTQVKGSWTNMVEHFAGERDHVVYLDARRSGSGASDSLRFSEFTITLANFLDVFYKPFVKYLKKGKKVRNKEQLVSTLQDLGDKVFKVTFKTPPAGGRRKTFQNTRKTPEGLSTELPELISRMEKLPAAEVFFSEEAYNKSQTLKKLFGTPAKFNEVQEAIATGNKEEIIAVLKTTAGYLNSEQFIFTPLQTKQISNEKEIAFLELGDEQLKKTWVLYGDVLRKTVTPVYTFMGRFNENVSKYFMGTEDGDPRKQHAIAAQQDLALLKEATDEAISAVEQADRRGVEPEQVNESEGDDKMKLSDWDRGNQWRPEMFANKPRKQTKKVVDALQQLTRDVFVGPDSQPQNLPGGIPKNFANMSNGTTVAAKYKPEDKEKIKELLSKVSLPPPVKKYSYYFGKAMSQQIELPMTSRENTSLVMVWIYKEKNQKMNIKPISTQGDSIQ